MKQDKGCGRAVNNDNRAERANTVQSVASSKFDERSRSSNERTTSSRARVESSASATSNAAAEASYCPKLTMNSS